ncbi:CGNR zinc finger domain-containing protein [Bordetella sp. 2513F-2]
MSEESAGATIDLHGDHPALDLINTVMTVDGNPVERWETDRDVLAWLRRTIDPAVALPERPPRGLLAAARVLREQLRGLLEARTETGSFDLAVLNGLLSRSPSVLAAHMAAGRPALQRVYGGEEAAALLAPVVEAAARLLAGEGLELVKRCENPACTLWFMDRSKSRRRRWCSMGLCGNRHKVATFRQRKAAG